MSRRPATLIGILLVALALTPACMRQLTERGDAGSTVTGQKPRDPASQPAPPPPPSMEAKPKSKEGLVFVFGGQSNMEGYAPIHKPTIEKLASVKNVYIYCAQASHFDPGSTQWASGKRPHWQGLKPCGGNGEKMGPEVTFGLLASKAFPDKKIYLIKFAQGGTSLFCEWQPPQRSSAYMKYQGDQICPQYVASKDYKTPEYLWAYRRFERTLLDGMGEIPVDVSWTWGGMLWLQGEADADGTPEFRFFAQNYQENLKHLIQTVRSTIKNPNLPFVAAKIKCGYDSSPSGGHPLKDVRDGIQSVANQIPGVKTIETWDLPMQESKGDCCHFNGESMLTIGERFAKALNMGGNVDQFPPPTALDCKSVYPVTPP